MRFTYRLHIFTMVILYSINVKNIQCKNVFSFNELLYFLKQNDRFEILAVFLENLYE